MSGILETVKAEMVETAWWEMTAFLLHATSGQTKAPGRGETNQRTGSKVRIFRVFGGVR